MQEIKVDEQGIQKLRNGIEQLRKEVGRSIVGQQAVVEEVLIAILARGHALLMGVPGLAKTLLVSSLSRALDLSFSRVQFTPDLMPSDITGTEIIEEVKSTGQRVFRFVQGPIFANIVLADEINRTPPKTQAALLQAMQEHQVTAGGKTYDLPNPFFVLATQNPIEQEGTYPLPEAQLDRFMFLIKVDYPDLDEEYHIVESTTGTSLPVVSPVLTGEDIIRFQDIVRQVPVPQPVLKYAVHLARATRPGDKMAAEMTEKYIRWGCGPRAPQYLVLGGRARALLQGRYNVSFADIRAVLPSVMRHRLITNFNAQAENVDVEAIMKHLLEKVNEPAD